MADTPLLTVHKLKRSMNCHTLWDNISFEVHPGEVWFVRGPSGVGKTLLLRAVACLDILEAGYVKLCGQSPSEIGIPNWRSQVMYVHQSRVNFKGTPNDFYKLTTSFCSQKDRPRGDLHALVTDLGLNTAVLDQQWVELSGGQAQRVALAVSLALQPKVLLLDEPTSACDPEAALKVEAVLKRCSAAILWVTHDLQQPMRVGGRFLELPDGISGTVAPTIQQSSSSDTLANNAATAGGGSDGYSGSSSSSSSKIGTAASSAGQGKSSLVS